MACASPHTSLDLCESFGTDVTNAFLGSTTALNYDCAAPHREDPVDCGASISLPIHHYAFDFPTSGTGEADWPNSNSPRIGDVETLPFGHNTDGPPCLASPVLAYQPMPPLCSGQRVASRCGATSTVADGAGVKASASGLDMAGNDNSLAPSVKKPARMCDESFMKGMETGSSSACAREEPSVKHRKSLQFERTITNATGLRILYIPQEMHSRLDLKHVYHKRATGRATNTGVVHLELPGRAPHAVTIVRSTADGHQHRRFTTGWREFCVLAGVNVGDALVFERGRRSSEVVVHVKRKGEH